MATTPFEQKFGILADSTLNDKMPSLKDYSLGFQLVQTEDDNSRAFGVQLYNIGKHLVMVPMFWLKGSIKGGEVMYVKDVNRFCPLTEIEINNIKSGKTFESGSPETNSVGAKDGAYSVSTMELNWLNSKRAGEVSVADPDDIRKMVSNVRITERIALKDIAMFGPKAASDLAMKVSSEPKLANALLSVHTASEIADALMPGIAKGEIIERTHDLMARPELRFIDDPYSKEASELPYTLKVQLIQDGIIALDSRKEASVAMKERKAVTSYGTPTNTGHYDILQSDGTVAPGDIIITDTESNICYSPNVRPSLDQSSTRRCILIIDGKLTDVKTSKVTVDLRTQEETEVGDEVTAERLRDIIKESTSESSWGKDDFNRAGSITSVIIYDTVHRIGFEGNVCRVENEIVFKPAGNYDGRVLRIVLTGKSGTLFNRNGVLYVPTTAKMIRRHDYKLLEWNSYTPSDIMFSALVNGGFETVKVASDGAEWRIDDERGGTKMSGYNDSFRYLVGNLGLRAKQASEMLRDAKLKSNGRQMGEPVSFWLKRAEDPADDIWQGFGNDHTVSREALNGGGPLDAKAIANIEKASQTGVKEIVDTQVMTELAKSAYSVDKAKDFIPCILKAIDRICRMLVLFYWHNEDFEERYGKQNMPQIEDALKENIRSLGDLVMYLMNKTVKDVDMEDSDDDLEQEMAQ